MKERRMKRILTFCLISLMIAGYTVFPSEFTADSPIRSSDVLSQTKDATVVSIADKDLQDELPATEPVIANTEGNPAADAAGEIFADESEAQQAVEKASPAPLDDTAGTVATADAEAYEENEIYVTYTDGSAEVLTCADKEEVAQSLNELAEENNVAYVQPNYTYTMAEVETPNDPYFAKQWALYNDGSFVMDEKQPHPEYTNPLGLHNVGEAGLMADEASTNSQVRAVAGVDINYLEAAEKFNDSGREIIIALIDTGVDYTHEDLQGSLWVNPGEIAGNHRDDDGNGYADDVYGWNFFGNNNKTLPAGSEVHGTHVAGILAAATGNQKGIAGTSLNPNVKIMCLKVLGGRDGSGSTASIVNAIRYAEENGASICNLSLCSDANDQALYRAIAGSSMLFITASGNTGADIDRKPSYPASYDLDNIIAVANMQADGRLEASSDYGVVSVDIAAPGTSILSTTPGNTYGFMSGTSMATPMVTAAAATVYAHYEDITPADIRNILLSTARTSDELTGKVSTGGMLDMGAALSLNRSIIQQAANERTKTGSSPEIYTQVVSYLNQNYLVVKVRDMDGDLAKTLYASGNLTAPDFIQGSVGRPFDLNPLGLHIFAIRSGGTYTFYAADSSGNETVRAVAL